MHLRHVLSALLGLSSLAAAAPALSEKELESKHEKRTFGVFSPLAVVTTVQTTVTIIQQNINVVDQIAALAEQELAGLIQHQLVLNSQIHAIKNNIRLNHFKSRFKQVNVVVVTVTCVVDARDSLKLNNRYLINQLYADNGFPGQQLVVMVTDLETLSILPTATVDVNSVFESAAAVATDLPILAGFDHLKPFGDIGQSVILPYGAQAPSLDLHFLDPARIVYENQIDFFLESPETFVDSCAFFQQHAQSFINLGGGGLLSSFEDVYAKELAGLSGFDFYAGASATDDAEEAQFTAEVIKDEDEDENEDENEDDAEDEKDEDKKKQY